MGGAGGMGSASGGMGGTGGMGMGGAGGSAGSGGSMGCTPGSTDFCYSGPPGTEIVGVCKAGLKTCLADGTFGPCMGEIVPSQEMCSTMGDDDCDGMVNEEGPDCTCAPNTTAPCYTAAMNTLNVGDCKAGTQACNAQGTAYGPCIGEVTPQMENCAMPGDEDCDGQINEGGLNCVCMPNTTSACYTGPMNTENVGNCKSGMHTCNADGTAFGPCMGEIVPQTEDCAMPGDEDCDGQINEGGLNCVCAPNTTTACYTGPAGTQNVGLCKGGTKACNAQGTAYGPCVGEIVPAPAESCNTAGDDDCDGMVNEGCSAIWVKTFGGILDDEIYDVAVDAQGNIVVVGGFTGTVDFGGGPFTTVNNNTDIFIAKFDAQGNHIWSRQYGANGIDRAHSVAVDGGGNVLVTGVFQSTVDFGGGPVTSVMGTPDIFVLALSPTGGYLISRAFGGPGGDEGSAVAFDSQGNGIIVGHFTGTVDFGGGALTSAGNDDGFIVKYSALGLHVWSKRYGDATAQNFKDVATNANNDIFVTGSFNGQIDFGGGPITSFGAADAMLAKLDSAGNHMWTRQIGGANVQNGASLAIDLNGNVVVTGSVQSTVDFGLGPLAAAGNGDIFIAKYNGNNMPQWAKIFGDNFDQTGLGIDTDMQNNVLLAGRMTGSADLGGGLMTSAGGNDMFMAKFDPAGAHTVSRRVGDSLEQWARSVGTDAANNIVVVGRFQGNVDFGTGTLTSNGGSDAYIVKYGP